jgi:hypothetical protein
MPKEKMKGNNYVSDLVTDNMVEEKRIITMNSEIIKFMGDGNFIIYFPDGSLTYSDKRKGIWYTINSKGVKRIRKVSDGTIMDEEVKLKITTKIDPETNATLKIREDGVLYVSYVDGTTYIIMPDNTSIVKKKWAESEGGSVTYITKDGYAPVR